MIKLTDINRIFFVGDQRVHALNNINLDINQGEYISVMGPSGSGKSTLLNVLGLLDRPNSGEYWLAAKDMTQLDENQQAQTRREEIGFIFQSYHLISRLTAFENVELPMMLAGISKAQRRDKVSHMLAELGLEGRSDHRPNQLSGGQRQRVAIARAIVMQPKILLADEPTGNLDRKSGEDVIQILEGLHDKGLTILIVTHDPEIGTRSHRRIKMVDGKIQDDVTQK